MRNKVRVAIVLDTLTICYWQAAAVSRVLGESCADVVALITLSGIPATDPIFGPNRWQTVLYRAYARADARCFSSHSDPFSRVPLTGVPDGVARLEVWTVSVSGSWSICDEDLERVRSLDADVFIYLGSNELGAQIASIPRFGLWFLHHGDYNTQRGGPPGFWEVAERRLETGVALCSFSGNPAMFKLLAQAFSCTHGFSPAKNRNEYYFRGISLISRALRELHMAVKRHVAPSGMSANPGVSIYSYPRYEIPRNIDAVRPIAAILGTLIRRIFRKTLFVPQWFLVLGVREGDYLSSKLNGFHEIRPKSGIWWADPFLYERDGRCYIFFEDLPLRTGRGRISVIEVSESGPVSEPKVVMDLPYHLSYPFIFEWDRRLFMIPESGANRTVQLYECTDFPTRWEHRINLMEGRRTVDTTLVWHEDRWWMFTALVEEGSSSHNDEVHLFWSKELLSTDWTPHPLNPVVCDVRRARPAGRIFKMNGSMYRPSQDCSGSYGRALNVNEIIVMTEETYVEEPVSRVEPRWRRGLTGVHSLDRAGKFTVLDAMSWRRRFFG